MGIVLADFPLIFGLILVQVLWFVGCMGIVLYKPWYNYYLETGLTQTDYPLWLVKSASETIPGRLFEVVWFTVKSLYILLQINEGVKLTVKCRQR